AGASWTDRNLFGEAEQLTLNARAFNLGGSASAGPGYDVSGVFNKPDFLRNDQSLQFSLSALKQSLVAYDQQSATGGVTLTRRLSSVWDVSVGLTLQQETIQQAEVANSGPDKCQAIDATV